MASYNERNTYPSKAAEKENAQQNNNLKQDMDKNKSFKFGNNDKSSQVHADITTGNKATCNSTQPDTTTDRRKSYASVAKDPNSSGSNSIYHKNKSYSRDDNTHRNTPYPSSRTFTSSSYQYQSGILFDSDINDKFKELKNKIEASVVNVNNLVKFCAEFQKIEYPQKKAITYTVTVCKASLEDFSAKVKKHYDTTVNDLWTDWHSLFYSNNDLVSYRKKICDELWPLKTEEFNSNFSFLNNFSSFSNFSCKLENYLGELDAFCYYRCLVWDIAELHKQVLKNVDIHSVFLTFENLKAKFCEYESSIKHYIPNAVVIEAESYLQAIEMKLIRENADRKIIELQNFLDNLRENDWEKVSKDNLILALKETEKHLALILEVRNNILKLNTRLVYIFNSKIDMIVPGLDHYKNNFITLINKLNVKDAERFCKNAKDFYKEVNCFQGNLTDLQTLKSKIENAIFNFQVDLIDGKLKNEVLAHKNTLGTLLADLNDEERNMEVLERAEKLIKEMGENREKSLTTTDLKEMKETLEKDGITTSAFWGVCNFISKNLFGIENLEYERKVETYKKLAEEHEKIMKEKVKIRENMLCNFSEDAKLENDCYHAMEKNNSLALESFLSQVKNRIGFYTHHFDSKEFKDELNGELNRQIRSLETISVKLSDKILYIKEHQALVEKINHQQRLCKQANIFWGNLSELDELLNNMEKINSVLLDTKFCSKQVTTEKETIVNELLDAIMHLEDKREIIIAKGEIETMNEKITELEKSVSIIENTMDANVLNHIKGYKINMEGLSKTMKEIDTYNHDRLKKEVDTQNEKLRNIRVNLERIEMECENICENEDEEDDFYEDGLDQLQLTQSLAFLSDIGLSLMKILNQLDKNSSGLNMANLKAEFEEKNDFLLNYKCCNSKEEEYKKRFLVLCNTIKERIPKETRNSNVLEEIKLESLKAAHYYSEIVSASQIGNTKATEFEKKIIQIMSKLDMIDLGHDKDTSRETRRIILNLCHQSLFILKSKLKK